MRFSKMFLMLILTMVLILGTMGSAFAEDFDFNFHKPPQPSVTVSIKDGPLGDASVTSNVYWSWGDWKWHADISAMDSSDNMYTFVKWQRWEEVNPPGPHNSFWTWVDSSYSQTDSFIIYSDKTFRAVFETNYDYNYTLNTFEMGSNEGTGAGYKPVGTLITVDPDPEPGYHFVNWTMNGSDMGNAVLTFNMPEEDVEVVLNFAENDSYNVHGIIDPSGSGTIDGTGDYPYEMPVELTAIPEHGYYFDHWTFDPQEVSPAINGDMMTFDMPENDVDVTAIFGMLDMYGVTLIPMETEWGMPELDENAMPSEDYDGMYYIGDEFTITPNPALHYHFVSYVMGEEEPITDPDHVFTMGEGDMEITVNYAEDPYVLATIQYLDENDVSIKADDVDVKVYLGDYSFAPPAISGYSFGVSSPNATGTITEESDDFVVIHKYYVPEVVTNTVTNTVTETVFVNVPATTEATTEEITTEPVPLGEATVVNFDSIYDDMEMPTTEEIMLPEEETPLADALPQTGQLPGELFYGIGGLLSAVGVFMKRRFGK
ncbi:MucBP domain-containing protein [Fusibacter bizertensis]|uniref:MucBP domain-containing protein n=1 Tax=Fusibacter bizertensis TaxID=1488331 RepID=A0ABT6NFM4_9FIRM|nr:MucBP domain-containing protein [Fusibacter bizertensis]MDH8679233.1 MucBP domain-containing protein [Fusibacter bizertensis]